jgi:hypothetical protein
MRLVIVVPLACSSIASTIPCFEVGFWLALFEAGFTTPAFCGFADLAIVLVLDEPRRDLGVSDFSADHFDADFRGFGLRLVGAICFSFERQHQGCHCYKPAGCGREGETWNWSASPQNRRKNFPFW